MAYYSDQDPHGGSFHQGGGARAEGLACGAGELRGLLQNIADHIANADERQQATLREMQSRLVHLAGEAQSARAAVPPELAAAFARIEDGITALTERMATDDAERSARSGYGENAHQQEARPDLFGTEPCEDPAPQHQPAGDYRSRGVADPPPPLKSAATHSDYAGWDRGGAHAAYLPYPDDAFAPGPETDDLDSQWDRASAEALTRLYEPDNAAMQGDPVSPIRTSDGGNTSRSLQASAAGIWLEQRFEEVAARLEETLASMRPDSSVAALESRLDTFEQKLGSAFDDLATRADVEKLKAIGAHINELAQQFDGAQSQLGRLDHIESHLTLLIEHISDERFVQLLEQRAFSEPHIAQLAEAVAERLAEREAHRGESWPGMDRLLELRDIIEQFVASRRQGDEHTASALDAIQQAVLNLLDRMEALEQAHAYYQAAAHRAGEPDPGIDRNSDQDLSSSQFYQLPAGGPLAEEAAALTAASAHATSTRNADFSGIGVEIQQARNALRSELRAQSAASEGHARPCPDSGAETAAPLHTSREDFLAAARRAARKASSDVAEDRADVARPRRGRPAPGEQRSTNVRPLTGLVVATLAVVLAVGIGLTTYSIYRGASKPAGVERSVLEPGTEHSAVGLDGEGMTEGGAAGGSGVDAPASRAATAPSGSETLENVPEIVIDDLPVAPGTPDVEDDSPRTRTVTGMPGGIMLDNGSIASTADIARINQQRSLAQLSTRLGAAQAGAASIPAALIPQSGDAQPVASSQGRQAAPGNRIMPPAAVGPLSLRLAAANGDPSAEFEVAVRLAEGRGVSQDLTEAVSWYQRSAARGFAPAQYRLGTLYERGLGVNADRGRAMAWYRSAAEKGNLKAMHNLAVLNASANPANYRTAAHWFAEAASRGLGDSQYNLAVLYETGRGVDRDLKQAYKWFALAARGGDKEAVRRRDRVKLMLDATQLKAAEALVRSWKQVATEPLVNDARAAGEAWKQREGQS